MTEQATVSTTELPYLISTGRWRLVDHEIGPIDRHDQRESTMVVVERTPLGMYCLKTFGARGPYIADAELPSEDKTWKTATAYATVADLIVAMMDAQAAGIAVMPMFVPEIGDSPVPAWDRIKASLQD